MDEIEVYKAIKHDVARLSRAMGLVDKVSKNVKDVDTDHIAIQIKLYCSIYEIKNVKNILERIVNEYKKRLE
jgi:hypothetical protein